MFYLKRKSYEIIFFFNFNLVVDGVVIYPREPRCSRVGGMCVEKDKCKSLVSASGLCPNSQSKGVECCFERKLLRKQNKILIANKNFLFSYILVEPQYEICHHQLWDDEFSWHTKQHNPLIYFHSTAFLPPFENCVLIYLQMNWKIINAGRMVVN